VHARPPGNAGGKSSESVQCAITGPCLRMRHRPSAPAGYAYGLTAVKTAIRPTVVYTNVNPPDKYHNVGKRQQHCQHTL